MFPVVGFQFWGSHLVFQDGGHCQILKWCFIAPPPLPLPRPVSAPLLSPPPSDEEEDWFKPPPFLPFLACFPPEPLPFLKGIRKRSPEDFEVEGWSRANWPVRRLRAQLSLGGRFHHWGPLTREQQALRQREFPKPKSGHHWHHSLLSARAAERKWIRRSKPASSFWRVAMAAVR